MSDETIAQEPTIEELTKSNEELFQYALELQGLLKQRDEKVAKLQEEIKETKK